MAERAPPAPPGNAIGLGQAMLVEAFGNRVTVITILQSFLSTRGILQ
jgi:hypothetical protein